MTQIGEQEDDPAEWPDSNHPYVLVSTLYTIARTSFSIRRYPLSCTNYYACALKSRGYAICIQLDDCPTELEPISTTYDSGCRKLPGRFSSHILLPKHTYNWFLFPP
jgi:hypothetical protein